MTANNHDNWEKDPVWDLLDEVPPVKAGPLFSRNVMREIRLATPTPVPWWRRLLAPLPLTAGAVAAAAVFAVLVAVNEPGGTEEPLADDSPAPAPAAAATEFDVAQGLLATAAENPSLFSDEEVLGLLYD